MAKTKERVLLRNPNDRRIKKTAWAGFARPIVIRLTPAEFQELHEYMEKQKRDDENFRRRELREERKIEKENAASIRRHTKQSATLISVLKSGAFTGSKRICSACGKKKSCQKHRDNWFCSSCIHLGANNEIEVVCPRHKSWCGGGYGSCSGCLGEDDSFF